MKLWFEQCPLEYLHEDSNVKFGIGWYRHHRRLKWWGVTVEFYVFKWMISANYVSNWQEYDKKINWRKYKKK